MPHAAISPTLPGELRARPTLSLRDRLRGRRLGMPWTIPDAAYHQPFLMQRSPVGRMMWIGDPTLAKHVLVDAAANYPKAEIELRLFSALFGQGLLGIDGDIWRTHRRTMAPAFDPRSVATYGPAMTACAEAFAVSLDARPDGEVLDIAEAMTGLTLSIIARTMFGAEGAALEPLIRDSLRDAPEFSDFNLLDLMPWVGPRRMKSREARMAALFQPLDDAIGAMIAAREAGGAASNDLLARLIAARDETTGAGLSAREIRDEIITIFVAGHETTANAMTWIWYLLAQHPSEQVRLYDELAQVLAGRTPSQADIPALPLTRRVVDEALRMFPPAPGMSARVAKSGDVVGGQPVKAGTYMLISPWLQQRHRQAWDNPERFDPDRFLPERSQGRPRLAHMPFGAGPRVCIGQLMATHEIILILATVAQHYAFDLASDAPVRLHHNVTLSPRGGLPMRLRRRTTDTAAEAA